MLASKAPTIASRTRWTSAGNSLASSSRSAGATLSILLKTRSHGTSPALLLLDEPSLGLAPATVQALFATIREINRAGTTILLVEQNAFVALKTADRGYVLENGRIVLTDTADRLLGNPHVRDAYLGSARGTG